MKRIVTLLITAVMALFVYGQKFHAGVYKATSDRDYTITFYLNGTFESQLLEGFPLCYDVMGTFDGASARAMIAIGSLSGQYSFKEDNYSVSGYYTRDFHSVSLTITGTKGVKMDVLYRYADFGFEDDEIYIGDETFRLIERFETERERKAREAQEAREYAEWEKQQEAERRAEEARLAKEAKEKAKQWDAVIAAKNKGQYDAFNAEVEKYCQMNISDEEKCKVHLEQVDFFKSAGNYSEAMNLCESFISDYASRRTLETYTMQAKKMWNELSAIAIENAKETPGTLAKLTQVQYISNENHAKAFDYLRQYEFENIVLKEKDFRAVLKHDSLKCAGVDVFDDAYVQKIHQYSETLRADSIATLLKLGEERLVVNDYHGATQTFKTLLGIDSANSIARQRLPEAELELIKQTPTQTLEELREKCKTYQKNYAYANDRCNEVGDLYVRALLSDVSKNYLYSYIQEIDEVARSFRMSDASRESLQTMRHQCQKKLDRRAFRDNRRAFRDSMFHGEGNFVGVKVGAGIGGGNGEFGWQADANLRFGRMCNWFNIVVGGRYVAAKGQDSDKERGRLAYSQFVIPAELRWNIYHGDECAFYLGAGAECHLPLKGDYAWRIDGSHADGDAVYDYSESKKEYLASAYWAPRLSLGITTRYFELEVFGSKASQGKYNTELLQKEKVDKLIGQDIFDTQINGGLFIGAAVRLGF